MHIPPDLATNEIQEEIIKADIESRLGVELTEAMQEMFSEEIQELFNVMREEKRLRENPD